MNTISMYLLLHRAKRGLNLIIVGAYTMKAIGLSAVASGILIIITRWLGWSGANFLGWFLLTCGGGVLGLVIGLVCKRWDDAGAARWIDTRFGFQDAITAALICIDRNCSGLLDQAIVDHAQLVAAEPLQIKWPLSRFYRHTIQAGLLIGVAVLALFLVPAQLKIHHQPTRISEEVSNNSGSQPGKRKNPPVSKSLAPRELAKMLFPQDPNLMAKAEEAIMAGNLDYLQELLRKAMLNQDRGKLDQTSSTSKLDPATNDRRQLMQNLIAADSMEEVQQEMMDQNQGQQSERSETEGQAGDQTNQELAKRQSSKGSKQGRNQSQANQEYRPEYQNQNPYQLQQAGTNAYNSSLPGQGEGTKKGSYSKITPESDSQKKPIILANKGGFFEYLLPGKDARVPLSGVLPGAAQATEQALSRQGAPGEYADFTRSYFIKLAQFITGSSPESEGKP
ncbi:MAG TPA: hypothetical protein VHY08_01565 [Bacillota bacterium]|nr:hypothetical protein [Bacillota bacterium]